MKRLDELAADAGLTPQTNSARADNRPGLSTSSQEGTRVTTEEAANGKPRNLYQKLAHISGELGAIAKDGKAPDVMGGFAFISHGALMGHLRSALAEQHVMVFEGLSIVTDEAITMTTTRGERSARRVVVKLSAEFIDADDPDGRHSVEWYGEALDTADKAVQKAATSAEKALLMKTFKVSDRDDPDAAEAPGEMAASGQAARSTSGLTTPAQARQQPPQGRTPQPDRPDTCPKCGKTGTLLHAPDGGALCVAAKNGCGAKLTKDDFAAPAPAATGSPGDNVAPTPEASAVPAAQPAPTLTQQIAIACREIGITDTAGRDRLRLAVTGKEKNADLTEAEALKVLKAAKSIGRGEARLENREGAWHVVDIARGAA